MARRYARRESEVEDIAQELTVNLCWAKRASAMRFPATDRTLEF